MTATAVASGNDEEDNSRRERKAKIEMLKRELMKPAKPDHAKRGTVAFSLT